MVKVILKVPMAGARAWNVGDEFECNEKEAKRMIKAGHGAPLKGDGQAINDDQGKAGTN